MPNQNKHNRNARTLKEVAIALGVSRTTVSNAFNRPDQLSQELRDTILTAARTMGYPGPNPMARMLRTGRAGAVGLLFSEPLSYAFDDAAAIAFLRGVAQVCEQVKSSLLILPVIDDAAASKTIQAAAVDGFIIYCLPDDSPVVPRVLERQLPVVAVDHAYIPNVASIGIDDREGARLAAAHLLKLRHRQLAIMSLDLQMDHYVGPVDAERRADGSFRVSVMRLLGYEDALRAAGLDPMTVPVYECPNNSQGYACQNALALLSKEPRPTGILAMSDRLALGVLQAAEQLGLRVPEDLSVIGFDDIPLAAQIRPALTTIHQPLVEKGVAAAELLLVDTNPRGSRILETALVVRDSTGPVPHVSSLR